MSEHTRFIPAQKKYNPAGVPHYLRFLHPDDAQQFTEYFRRNQLFHRPWSPRLLEAHLSIGRQRELLNNMMKQQESEEAFHFGIFTLEDDLMIGKISLTAIERGVFENGRFGYSIDEQFQGKGLMTSSIKEIMKFAFLGLSLHRLEANIMTTNQASRRVLEKCGFQKIGTSPKMLFMNGKWEDHDMYMILNPHFS
jgi:ribosomal-protein-alanine N-acetyltransferase